MRLLAAAVLAVAGAGTGAALTPVLTPLPEAEADLLVSPLPGAAFHHRDGNTLVDLGTEAQLALSDPVLQRVAPGRGTDPAALRQRLSVRLVPNAEVVVVQARAGTGERAASLAQRVAEETLDERRRRAVETLERRSRLLSTRIARTEVDVERAAEAEDLAATQVLSQRLVTLREDLQLLASGAQDPGALLGTSTVLPRAAAAARLGLPVAGLVAGGVAGWVAGSLVLSLRRRGARVAPHAPAGASRRVRSSAAPLPIVTPEDLA